MTNTPKRRWWQFRISTILLWMAIVCLSAGWWSERVKRLHEQKAKFIHVGPARFVEQPSEPDEGAPVVEPEQASGQANE